MSQHDADRREFLKISAGAAMGAALSTHALSALSQPAAFDIEGSFAQYMNWLGARPDDGGGKVTFTGQDPIVRSHFRIASCMAIPAMAAGVLSAAIWKDRTGDGQDVHVDLREAMYNVNPLIGIIMKMRMKMGAIPANDPVARNFSFEPTINGRWYQAPLGVGNPITFQIFPVRDGRLFTLSGPYPHLMDRILNLLKVNPERPAIAAALKKWDSTELDEAIGEHRICGGMHRTAKEWLQHPQGKYLSDVPLVEIVKVGDSDAIPYSARPTQPLSGLKVLSLTHVIAGTTCARTLAEQGAQVLHVARDQSFEHEGLVTDVNVGMRSTFLDLRRPDDSKALNALIPQSDVFIEGFSGRSIERLGFGVEEVAKRRPGVIYVSLRCYGWDGPWRDRQGFDMEGLTVSGFTMTEGGGRPKFSPTYGDAERDGTPPPAFPPTLVMNDYVAGYIAASGVLTALRRRAREGGSYHVRVSLTRAAMWFQSLGEIQDINFTPGPMQAMVPPETVRGRTPFGDVVRLAPLAKLSRTPGRWRNPLIVVRGSDLPVWEA
jgi:crotonobetainyl-CoA:carnitine CoA-transferase CaiB-like acyl-CoA transferase